VWLLIHFSCVKTALLACPSRSIPCPGSPEGAAGRPKVFSQWSGGTAHWSYGFWHRSFLVYPLPSLAFMDMEGRWGEEGEKNGSLFVCLSSSPECLSKERLWCPLLLCACSLLSSWYILCHLLLFSQDSCEVGTVNLFSHRLFRKGKQFLQGHTAKKWCNLDWNAVLYIAKLPCSGLIFLSKLEIA
jgi:hypothetical protein